MTNNRERIENLQLQINNLNECIAIIDRAYAPRLDRHADEINDQGEELIKLRDAVAQLERGEGTCVCKDLEGRIESLEAISSPPVSKWKAEELARIADRLDRLEHNSYSPKNEENMTITPEPGRFGPQTDAIEALLARAETLTPAEVETLGAPWDGAWDAARDAARDATWALVVRDLIGQHGLTQAHYDLLAAPWATTIGKVHPDDDDRMAKGEQSMAEPGNVGAVVVDAFGDKWTRIKEREFCWINKNRGEWNRWGQITHPQPFHNIVLTANDPEPPTGSVVLDGNEYALQADSDWWHSIGDSGITKWADLNHPVTLAWWVESK